MHTSRALDPTARPTAHLAAIGLRHALAAITMVAFAMLTTACADTPHARPYAATPPSTAPTAAKIPAPFATPARSPDTFRVKFATSKGDFVVAVRRALAPRGSDRFHELVTVGYFTDVRFFRVVPGFVVQFGIHGDPAVNDAWKEAAIPDDAMRLSNTRGTVTFAAAGPNSRTTQLFVSTGSNARRLDAQRLFAPIGTVVEGMDVVDKLNAEYGEEPNHARIARQGNAYLERWFPALDYIKGTTVIP